MANLVNLARITEYTALPVTQNRAVFPTAFPEFVTNLQILLCVVVARVVFGKGFLAQVLRAAFQIRGDDIPACAPLGQVIQRRQATGKRIRMFERQRRRQAEAQVLGHQRHGRDELQRVINRHLGGLANRRLAVAAIHVINAQHIGNEQPIELAALEDFRQIGPVFEVLVLPGAVARMRPEARRLMADAVHVKRVEADLAGHTLTPEAVAEPRR